ncbi:hypothetical protein [Streptomyces javensis]|uniref:Uncharacterized protein n=1 Tax=Streptomyces javensis TaxID=114698 RepID=A0ABS0RBK0_9ACTN|nr:hypothetical protein [Streptomyces javensis]MBI0314749.1 hypothetical protein [Streptomyces javensis]
MIENLTLQEVRKELEQLVALAQSGERPRPTLINPPGHPMPGWEWVIEQRTVTQRHTTPTWWVRTVDEPETSGAVYVSSPDCMEPGEEFGAMFPTDARRLGLALIAAADRAEHVEAGVPRIEDHRPDRSAKPTKESSS